ncbi:MAG: hypothetical protein FJX77_15315, partial [Armatimonadetes bacterium]|nr:hypothetical protein [Armatimonadota bacterium]
MKVEWQGRQRELKELVDLHREAVATSETGVAQELALVTSRLQMEYGLWYAAERTCLETPGGDRNWRLLLRKWQARRRLGSEPQWEDLQRARELAPEPQRDLAPELLRELS